MSTGPGGPIYRTRAARKSLTSAQQPSTPKRPFGITDAKNEDRPRLAGERRYAGVVGSQPARAPLLPVAGARAGDPQLLQRAASGAGNSGDRRGPGHEPLDHAPLRDHPRGPRL